MKYTSILCAMLMVPTLAFSGATTKKVTSEAEAQKEQKETPIAKSYDGGMSGLKALMRDLKAESPEVHEKLLPDFNRLKKRQTTATIASIAGFGAGGYFIFKGLKLGGDLDSDENGMTDFLIGSGFFITSYIVSGILAPKTQQYKDFTNKHNTLNKKSQITWDRASVMFLGKDQPIYVALNFKF